MYFYIGNGLCLNVLAVVLPCLLGAGALITLLVCCLAPFCPWYHCCLRRRMRHRIEHGEELSSTHVTTETIKS